MVIKCTYIQHKNKSCILLYYPYYTLLNKVFNQLEFVKYSNTYKGWYIPQNKELLQQIIEAVTAIATVDITTLKLNPQEQSKKNIEESIVIQRGIIIEYNTEQLKLFFQTLILKGYSPATIKTYKNEFLVFLQTLNSVAVDSLTTQRIKDYL